MGNSRSLLKHPDFLKLWTGETISVFGAQFSGVALPLIAVVTLQGTPLQLGILNALALLAFPLFGLFVGVWADRHRKRPTLIAADLGRMFFLALIPVSAAFGSITMTLLYIVAFSVGTLQTFFDISYQAYLPFLVDSDQLVEGNSRLETSRATAQTVGPGVAGVAVQLLSAPTAILGDVVGYLGSAAFLTLIRKPEQPLPKREVSVLSDIKEGLGVILHNKNLRAVAACTGTFNLFSNAFGALIAILILRDLGFNILQFGLMFSVGSVGGVLAAITVLRFVKRLGIGNSVILGILISGLPSISLYFVNGQFAFPIIAFVLFLGTFGGVIYNVAQVSYRQAIVPLELQGRMNASMRVLVWGPIPAGAILGGVLGTLFGVRPAILIGAIGTTLAFLWVLFSPVRNIKEIPKREEVKLALQEVTEEGGPALLP